MSSRLRPYAPGARPPRRRHPALQHLEPGVWHPEAVGSVRGYPATPEAYADHTRLLAENAQRAREAGKLNRRGVPNGWRGQPEERVISRRNAQTAAEMLADEILPTPKGWEAEIADRTLREVLVIACDPVQHPGDRLRAARLFLDFILPRPLQRVASGAAGGPLGFLEQLVAAAADKDANPEE